MIPSKKEKRKSEPSLFSLHVNYFHVSGYEKLAKGGSSCTINELKGLIEQKGNASSLYRA